MVASPQRAQKAGSNFVHHKFPATYREQREELRGGGCPLQLLTSHLCSAADISCITKDTTQYADAKPSQPTCLTRLQDVWPPSYLITAVVPAVVLALTVPAVVLAFDDSGCVPALSKMWDCALLCPHPASKYQVTPALSDMLIGLPFKSTDFS